jgi:hypothetical protein
MRDAFVALKPQLVSGIVRKHASPHTQCDTFPALRRTPSETFPANCHTPPVSQVNDVHRVRFTWFSPQALDDEFELVIRDLDSGKNVSAGAALADTGVDPMFLSVFEWLTLSGEVAEIARKVDLQDVAEESRRQPIKAISLEQVRRMIMLSSGSAVQ